jgi:hypothetical protein
MSAPWDGAGNKTGLFIESIHEMRRNIPFFPDEQESRGPHQAEIMGVSLGNLFLKGKIGRWFFVPAPDGSPQPDFSLE